MKEVTSDFAWAENKLKLQRAILKSKIDTNTDGTGHTEESIMEWYKKLGGNVIGKIKGKAGRPPKQDDNEDTDKAPQEQKDNP